MERTYRWIHDQMVATSSGSAALSAAR